jgi:hypothetical protein
MLAAEGRLAPRAHEQLGLLMLLTVDPDPDIRTTAEKTISRLPAGPVGAFLTRSDVSPELRDFFASRGFPASSASATDDPGLAIEAGVGIGDAEAAESEAGQEARLRPTGEDPEHEPAVNRLARMTVVERMKVALRGTREERNLLVRDPNRLVSCAVLSSPKLTESEVEAISRMGSVSDDVLRIIGTTRAWVKNYNIVAALTRNAKTPLAISLTLMPRLNARDMRTLSTDRNVPEPLRVAARKQVVFGDSRKH